MQSDGSELFCHLKGHIVSPEAFAKKLQRKVRDFRS